MSDSLKEVVDTIKDAIITPVQEAFVYRARNPFFGSLIISWVYFNWNKIAFFFLSDMEIEKRIAHIKHTIPDNSVIFNINIPHSHSLLFPLFSALAVSLLYPFLTFLMMKIHGWISFKIETTTSANEAKRLKLQEEIIDVIASNETRKSRAIAIAEDDIASIRETTADTKYNITKLRETHNDLTRSIGKLSSEKETLDAIILNQQKKKIDLSQEVQELTVQFSPLQDKAEIIDKFTKNEKELIDRYTKNEKELRDKLFDLEDKLVNEETINQHKSSEIIKTHDSLQRYFDHIRINLSKNEFQIDTAFRETTGEILWELKNISEFPKKRTS